MKTNLSMNNIIEIADFAGLDFNIPNWERFELEVEFTLTDEPMEDSRGRVRKGMKIYCTEYPEEGAIFLDAIDGDLST